MNSNGRCGSELIDHQAGAAVARVHDDFQLAQLAAVDVTEQVIEIFLADVEALLGTAFRGRRRQGAVLDERGHLLQPGVGADRA